ncbi:MAG: hypothetical protein AABX07_02400 [Nanoarchaeota archaeon]|mgnify:CR=1 FL=1
MIKKAQKVTLPKTIGWIILVILVLLDALLDIIFAKGGGLESGIWKPISYFLGIKNPLLMIPFVLILFYLLVKGCAWIVKKIDKITIGAEELILTTLVIAYGLFDIWLILFYMFDFRLFKNHYYLIPVLILVGIIYEMWAEKKLRLQSLLQHRLYLRVSKRKI